MIFFPLAVDGLVEQLSNMKAIHHRLGLWQQVSTGVVKRLSHVGSVRLDLQPLLGSQFFQAFSGGCFIPARFHGHDLGTFRVGQVRQDENPELVPFLQAQVVDAQVGDPSLGIDLPGLNIGQLVADDQVHHLRRDTQPPGHFLFVTADEHSQHLLFKAEGVADLLATKGRDDVLPVMAE